MSSISGGFVSRIARLANFIKGVESSDVVLVKHLQGLHDQSSHGNWADNSNDAEIIVTPENAVKRLILPQLRQHDIVFDTESIDGVAVEDINFNVWSPVSSKGFQYHLQDSNANSELKSETAKAIAKSDAMKNVSTQELIDFGIDAVYFARNDEYTQDFMERYVEELKTAMTPAQSEHYDENGELINEINLVAETEFGEIDLHHWTNVLDYEIIEKLHLQDGKATPAQIAQAVRMQNAKKDNYTTWAMQGTSEADKMVRNATCSSLVKLWAQTSNDDYPASLAIQEAVKKQFNLSDSSDWPMSDETRKKVADITNKHGKVLQSYVQATYDLTQEFLAKQGIKEITVYRGVRDVASLGGVADSTEIFDVKTRPASAWSVNPQTAKSFASELDYSNVTDVKRIVGGVIQSVVDVSQVLGMAGTGMGCFHEFETVLLGKPMKGQVVPWSELRPQE